jgi:flagellar basal-body rod protein FlgF
MIKGIYTSAMAMRQGILRQEITANNLANANTTGFKRDDLFAKELTEAQNGTEGSDPLSLDTSKFTEFTPGAYNTTGNNLDFALQDKGFFVLSDGQTESYTRAGHFERNATGQLVDALGRSVQGEGGNITVPNGVITVAADGRISVDGKFIDRFRVVRFDDPQTLRKVEGSAFVKSPTTAAEVPVDQPVVRQGFLEMSNVDTVKEMVQMISTSRNYEINAKLLTAQDDTLRQSVGELGRV